MKKSIFLFVAIFIVAATAFSFISKENVVEKSTEKAYYFNDYVRYDGWGSCGLIFRSLNTGEQIWVVSQPSDMYLRIGSTFYITKEQWPYVNPNCTQWKITDFQQVSTPWY